MPGSTRWSSPGGRHGSPGPARRSRPAPSSSTSPARSALGVVTGFAAKNVGAGAQDFATIVGVGFIAAYTTFSTEEWHTLGLLRKSAAVEAFNVLGSLGASLVLAALGLWLGEQI
ncbi:fluoride efflux transporter FluC [Micromonospora sp. NPDC005223]|uniref:fluoride efflux transporter FluC n=1 Tax=unclassified Micromonospora TaxID=2617518 RepID=UPI0033E04F75